MTTVGWVTLTGPSPASPGLLSRPVPTQDEGRPGKALARSHPPWATQHLRPVLRGGRGSCLEMPPVNPRACLGFSFYHVSHLLLPQRRLFCNCSGATRTPQPGASGTGTAEPPRPADRAGPGPRGGGGRGQEGDGGRR